MHRERAHLKVPDSSIVLIVLLIRKLPTFLSRSNKIRGGYEKNHTSFRIILQYFKVVKNDGFSWVIVRMKCEGEWNINSVLLFLL